ncbi:hypothetical protein [Shewanella indica]|uniref:Uncharacterized protein n=1 Tax=Shewanella indica TaxID=768528 RepID=A0ABU4QGK8_9GAMM|nr:hypothetical protein [Shewanella indica]MDX6018018.1 hypothetical protein [Shewanella indica]
MCGLCLEQGFVYRFVTEGFDAVEKADPEFPHYWFEFSNDWVAIIERFKKQPDSALDNRVLWARLFITCFEKPLSERQRALWNHLSEDLAGDLPEYPTLSFQLDEASQFPLGIAAYIGQQGLNHTALLAEATALLERHLLRAHFCVTMLNCLGVNSGWELGDKEYGKNRDIFLDSCWHEFRHRLFACALLLTWAPESSTLQRFAVASPHYVVDFLALEYRLQRWLLQLCYRVKGAAFLADNAASLLPEHLLYLLQTALANVSEISAVSQAYLTALEGQMVLHPPHYGEQALREAFEMLSQRALSR